MRTPAAQEALGFGFIRRSPPHRDIGVGAFKDRRLKITILVIIIVIIIVIKEPLDLA